ncbi:MAG TPA: hypothetical protein DGF30_13115, partial [Desulfomicrobium sp.]|nr:hypothetical protein [Desulfomicrobium sp.]
MRIFLVILTFIALAGAADTFWRSPVILVLPVLCIVCLALVSRISSLERRLRELEGRAAAEPKSAARTRMDVPASAAPAADGAEGEFVFSEEAPARPVPAERPAPKAALPGFEARV